MSEPAPTSTDDEVVRLLTADSAPADRERAAARLADLIREESAVTRSFQHLIGRWVEEDALGYVYERLGSYRAGGPGLRAWVRAVLRNRCFSLHRQARRRPAVILHGRDPEDRGLPATEAEADRLFRVMNAALVSLAADRPPADLDHAAVFAFQVLLRAGNLAANGPRAPGRPASAEISRRLPLAERVWDSAFRPGYPPLRALWAAVTPVLDDGRRVTGKDVCQILADRFGNCPPVTPILWLKWMERSRENARARLGESVWQDGFGWLCRGPEGRL